MTMTTRYAENAGQMKMPQAFTYDDAEEAFGVAHHNYKRGMGPREGPIPLGGNTTIRRETPSLDIVIRLHDTDIITYHRDDTITLNSGGYHTNTTKGRINAFLSPKAEIVSKRGKWYIKSGSGVYPFEDGATLTSARGKNPPDEKAERLFHSQRTGKVLVSDKVWRAALDHGRAKEFPSYSDLGGYPLYYTIGERTARRNFQYDNMETVLASTINGGQLGEDDVVMDVDVNWEDDELYDGITGERIPSAYGENENPKSRQVNFRQTGGTAYGKAQRVAFDLRSAGYEAEQGNIPSSAGSWADAVYIMTNAPMGTVRKIATKEGLEIRK
jgi:hypothetical protein